MRRLKINEKIKWEEVPPSKGIKSLSKTNRYATLSSKGVLQFRSRFLNFRRPKCAKIYFDGLLVKIIFYDEFIDNDISVFPITEHKTQTRLYFQRTLNAIGLKRPTGSVTIDFITDSEGNIHLDLSSLNQNEIL